MSFCSCKYIGKDHPRTRGEKKFSSLSDIIRIGSPPHTRGKGSSTHSSFNTPRITPAHAGKRSSGADSAPPCGDHPRTRGEKSSPYSVTILIIGSPPHTRGKEFPVTYSSSDLRITPAHAGKREIQALGYRRNSDHPRTRGEKDEVYL